MLRFSMRSGGHTVRGFLKSNCKPAVRANLSSSAKAFDSTADAPQVPNKSSFSCQVPMEDTDCYGIVHHSGLMKYFDRSRQVAFGTQKLAEMECAGIHLHVTAMNRINFCNPCTLGMPLEVTTKVRDITGPRITWEQAIVKKGSDKLITCAFTQTTFHAWKDTKSSSPVATFAENGFSALDLGDVTSELTPEAAELPIKTDFESSANPQRADVTTDFLFQDGVDASGRMSHLSAYCMMERSRVNWLGGAKGGLAQMQKDGVLAVVRGIDDFGMLLPCLPTAGTPVTLRTFGHVQGNNTVTLHQDVCVHRDDAALLPVAGARVTILFVDAKTMRPCPTPQFLLDRADKLFGGFKP